MYFFALLNYYINSNCKYLIINKIGKTTSDVKTKKGKGTKQNKNERNLWNEI